MFEQQCRVQLPAQLLRYIQKLPTRYVADLYNPLMIELLEALADAGAPRERSLARRLTRMVYAQCAGADFIICASESACARIAVLLLSAAPGCP